MSSSSLPTIWVGAICGAGERGGQLATPTSASKLAPRLYDLESDPAEQHNLADSHPEIVASLTHQHQAWFDKVIQEWIPARARILETDKAYWQNRSTPDPAALFHDYWQWSTAPSGTDIKTADPLQIFRGYWNETR